MYLNRALIIGNLTRDPQLKALPSGQKACEFGVATNRVWKDQSGAKKEATDFHNIVVFGRVAENCGAYLKKGQNVMVEGRIQTRSWDGPDGKKNYRTEIVADNVQFGAKAGGAGGAPSQSFQSEGGPSTGGAQAAPSSAPEINYPTEDINPEDIPF
jgi:single-strand DNA-binding protein